MRKKPPTPKAADPWGPGTRRQNLCQNKRITNDQHLTETALLGKQMLLLKKNYNKIRKGGWLPEIGFRLVSHSQSFLFRHNKHSRGPISLKTHT